MHFWVNYIDLGVAAKHMFIAQRPDDYAGLKKQAEAEVATFVHNRSVEQQRQRVSCWAREEDLHSSLRACLSSCEQRLNASLVDWSAFDKANMRSNASPDRVSNSVLYDADTRALVAAAERHMFTFFGYDENDVAANEQLQD